MAEDNNNNWEGDNLNSDKTSYTPEEVEAITKKLQSDSEKWVQKLISEKKTFENVIDEVWKIADDKSRLVDLYEDNEEVANIILDKYYNWMSLSEYKDEIWYKIDENDPKIIEKRIESKIRHELNGEKIVKAKQEFIEKLKMSDDEKQKFEEAFQERTELRSFKTGDVSKHLEKAYIEISDDINTIKELKSKEKIAKTMATWQGWYSWEKSDNSKALKNEISGFLWKMGIIKK